MYLAMASKIRVKTVRSTIENKDVMSMFQGVLGTGESTDLNLRVVHPKYGRIRGSVSRFLALLRTVAASPALAPYPGTVSDLRAYSADLQANYAQAFRAPDLLALYPASSSDPLQNAVVQGTVDYAAVSRGHYDEFAGVYADIKKCNVVNTAVVTCKNLTPHRVYIENEDKLVDRFLTGAGMIFAPLPGLGSLNVKNIYVRAEDAHRKYLLYFLHKLYVICHEVYEAVTSPDIDVEDFIEVVVNSLDDLKKHVPRCDDAFRQMGDSVGLLRENFTGYYKDYVATDNPTIIMENFVLDVSKNAKAGPRVSQQFQKIIAHYRKIAANKAHDPRLKSLFSQVDANFAELEKSEGADDLAEEPADDADAADATAAETSGSPADASVSDLAPAAGESSGVDEAKARRNRKKRDARKTRDARERFNREFEKALAAEFSGTPAPPVASAGPSARAPARAAAETSGSLADEFAGL